MNQKSVIFFTISIFYFFKFQRDVCNRFQDVLMMSMNLSNVIILNVDYRCITNGISKTEAVNLLQKADLNKKKWKIVKYNFYLSRINLR